MTPGIAGGTCVRVSNTEQQHLQSGGKKIHGLYLCFGVVVFLLFVFVFMKDDEYNYEDIGYL